MIVCTWRMTQYLILWVLILNASLKPSESHGPEFEEGKHYEVVRPVRLHTVRKRHTEYHRPDALTYAMTVGGQDIEMQLERNNELLTKEYSETHYQEDGTRVTTVPKDIDHCYYHGRIVNDSESSVSISTCDGLRGYFRTSAQRYLIEPLSSDDEGDHAVTTFNPKNFTPAVCGVTNTSWSDDIEPPMSRSRSRSAGISIVQQQKYIELFLVADNREYVKMNRDQTKLRERIFEIVNFVNVVYKPLRTFIALVGLEIWSNNDLITVTPPAGANLEAFMKWRNSELVKRTKHDNAHLISGINFEGATVGLAYVGTLCSGHSVGIVQDHTDRAIAVGATLAHEMGHNLGMNHDDSSSCFCSGESCIMSAALSWKTPQTFSSCSTNNYENYQTTHNPTCLLDKPNYKNIVAPPVCGNGFREEGEQCDCGSVQECTNLCCNATTCTLKEGSQCAEGECCENCKISPTTRKCRRKQDDCDLAEYCDGKSTTCPEDVFAVNGLPCDGGLGYCYNGQCPQRPKQCVKMYGSGATEAVQSCYNHNTRGTYCRRPSKDQFIPCQQEDVLCGKLFCSSNNEDPNYGQMFKVGNCLATVFSDYTQDYSLVETGTKCGDGKVCSQSQCVDLQTAYRNTNCSAKCPGHAVCNHKSECQCEPGWKLPYCDTMDEAFSNTGKTIAIAVAVTLLILGIIAAIAGIIWKKRQSPTLPTAATQRMQRAVENPAYHLDKQPAPSYHGPVRQADRLKPEGPPPQPPPAGNKPKPGIQIYRAAPPPPAIQDYRAAPPPPGSKPKPAIQNYRVAPPPPAIQNYRVAPPPPAIQNYRAAPPLPAIQNYRVAPPPPAIQNYRAAPPLPAIQNYRVAPPPPAIQNYRAAPPLPGNKPKISITNYAAARQALRPVPPPKV